MLFQENTIENFEKVTGFDITGLFSDFISFVKNDKQQIVNYYSGDVERPNVQSFKNLEDLQDRVKQSITLMVLQKESFNYFSDWNLLQKLEEVQLRLLTISNSSKFLRSSITKNNFNSNPEIQYTLTQGQTLERVSRDVLGDGDYQNDWVKVQLRNDLKEEDYSKEGGNILQVSFSGPKNFSLNSVVDNLQGEKVLGLDIYKKLTFENDDLKVLSYKDTARQAILIYGTLKRGDNPDFLNDGIDEKLVVGGTVAALSFPSLFRQMSSLFEKDDTFIGFQIDNVRHEQDAVFIDFKVITRLGQVQGGSISI